MLNTIRKRIEKVKHPKRKLKVETMMDGPPILPFEKFKVEPLTPRPPMANIQTYTTTLAKEPDTMSVAVTHSAFAHVTKNYIMTKATRKRNPISSLTGLAEAAGIAVYTSETGSTSVSGAFRRHVMRTLGQRDYKKFLKGTL